MKLIRVYLAMCKNVDNQLEKLFACLKENNLWEDTLIIYTSDHGDFNGEHRLLQKFNSGYDGCCRVPLIISSPEHRDRPQTSGAPVNLVDLPATICEIMNWPALMTDQGRSLAMSLKERMIRKDGIRFVNPAHQDRASL